MVPLCFFFSRLSLFSFLFLASVLLKKSGGRIGEKGKGLGIEFKHFGTLKFTPLDRKGIRLIFLNQDVELHIEPISLTLPDHRFTSK